MCQRGRGNSGGLREQLSAGGDFAWKERNIPRFWPRPGGVAGCVAAPHDGACLLGGFRFDAVTNRDLVRHWFDSGRRQLNGHFEDAVGKRCLYVLRLDAFRHR